MEKMFSELDSIGAETTDALERFMGDAQMYEKYLSRFPQEVTMEELRQAVAAKDYVTAEKKVHAFKGIVKNLGLVPLADHAVDMLEELRDGDLKAALEAYQGLEESYKIFCQVITKWQTK